MTMIETHCKASAAAGASARVMSMTIAKIAIALPGERLRTSLARYRLWLTARQTERALAALPETMRKDFGWPGPDRS